METLKTPAIGLGGGADSSETGMGPGVSPVRAVSEGSGTLMLTEKITRGQSESLTDWRPLFQIDLAGVWL